jgi:hypothetical protein
MSGNQDNFDKVGFLTEAARGLFHFAKWLSVMQWLGLAYPVFRPRSALTMNEIYSLDFIKRRGRAIDLYVVIWLCIEFVVVSISCLGPVSSIVRLVLGIIVSSRILEVVQVTVNATLFDALSGRPDEVVGSRARMLVLAGLNFVELLLCFGVFYATNYQGLVGAGKPVTGFYFSVITQLTIGYGDVYPTGWLRLVAAFQGLVGALFIILVLGRLLASLRQIRGALDDK